MITREADYAIRLMLFLAGQEDPTRHISVREAAETMEVPYRFMRRVARRLVHGGLLDSRRGKSGGVRPARPIAGIRLQEVLSLLAPTATALNACLVDPRCCRRSPDCSVHRHLRIIQKEIDERLGHISFADLAAGAGPKARRHGSGAR